MTLSPELLQHIALARIVLLGCVGGLMILAYFSTRRRDAMNCVSTGPDYRLWIWAGAIGLAWALGTATILLPGHALLWGNQGDETFQIAFMERVISGQPFSDFFYADLSPFYPPLYFWIFGTLGRLFNWDGISAAQWGTILTYALLPLLSITFAKICAWSKREQLTALLLPTAMLLFLPTEALLLKPYEAATALFSVLWIVAFTKLLHEPSWRLRIILGLTGGIIFLLYYFWFVLLIPTTLILMVLYRKKSKKHLLSFFAIGCIVTGIASPFLIPYLTNLITLGQENYQSVYFFPSDIHLYAPWLSLSLFGLVALGSILAYILKKDWSDAQKAMLALGVTLVGWHLVQLAFLAFGEKSVMLSKPFLFLGGTTLLLPAMDWVARAWTEKDVVWRERFSRRVLMGVIIVACPLLPNGLFLDDAKVQAQLEQNLLPTTSSFVAENIRVFVPDYATRTWLTSGIHDINGILPLTHYLAWNPHFSHPSAHWSTRLTKLERIATSASPSEATAQFDALGIDTLLFYKTIDQDGNISYPFFYEEDAWPNGTQSASISFSAEIIDKNDWHIAHEDRLWVLFIRNIPSL